MRRHTRMCVSVHFENNCFRHSIQQTFVTKAPSTEHSRSFWHIQVGLINEETSNTPASVKYLLNLIPFRADDARIGGPDAAQVYADPPEDPQAPPLPEVDPGQFGIYPVTLGLVNTALEVRNIWCVGYLI